MSENQTKHDAVVEAVREDLLRRSQLGIAKYGVTLERKDLNLREWLQHAYEETLDQANYLKRAILEIDAGADVNAELARLFSEQNVRLKSGIRKILSGLPIQDGSLATAINRLLTEA